MTDNIFKIDPNRKADFVDEEKNTEQYYTIAGSEDFYDEDKQPQLSKNGKGPKRAFALKSTDTDEFGGEYTRYFILTNRQGALYNPMGTDGFESLNRKENGDKMYWELKAVSSKVFIPYLRFLKTKNQSHFYTAQRESHNG